MQLIKPQYEFANNDHLRYTVCHAGRRGGKTEIALDKTIRRGLQAKEFRRFFLGGPTYGHARRLFWDRMKRKLKDLGVGWLDKSESNLMLTLPTGNEIHVVGFDKAERFDGTKWHGGVADEFADMKDDVWREHIRPAMTDTQGWVDFTGVPAGRNHFYEMDRDYGLNEEYPYWGSYTWTTEDVLPLYLGEEAAKEEIWQAKNDMDEATFNQEYGGEFISFSGRAYYNFMLDRNVRDCPYDKDIILDLCFDFNFEPGVCGMVQEWGSKTRVVDEIFIKLNSNTEKVCDIIIDRYKNHNSHVRCFGDASGRNPGSAQLRGSDWEIIEQKLNPVFKDRLEICVPKANPPIISRVNSLNSRFYSVNKHISYYVDTKCTKSIQDFEGVASDEAGGIRKDKTKDKYLTHLSDGYGYREHYEHPMDGGYKAFSVSF